MYMYKYTHVHISVADNEAKSLLNLSQGILRVLVNGTHKANNSYVDPTLSICPPDTKK